MRSLIGLAVVVGFTLLIASGQCDVNCKGNNGHPGVAGIPGRDGRPGVKGQKGEPAQGSGPGDSVFAQGLKGDPGSPGKQGVMGPKGYRGEVGAAGPPGLPGRPGPPGRRLGDGRQSSDQGQSAFSVIRTDVSYPAYSKKVTFQQHLVNTQNDFNLGLGVFTARVAGIYYFNFHSMSKASMCLGIVVSGSEERISFCDYNRNSDQVLSGGVVLELTVGQKVWLESFKESQGDTEINDVQQKQIIFNGFLLY